MIDDANNPVPTDAALLALDKKVFTGLIADLLRNYRNARDLAFTEKGETQLLAASSLVIDCLLKGETLRLQVMGWGVQATLRWVVEQLWSGPKPGGNARGWWLYASLYYPYFEGETFESLAERLLISQETIYDWRVKALDEVAVRLRQELLQPQHQRQRKHYAIAERYWIYQSDPLDSANEQRLLRLCSLLHQPLPLHKLQNLAQAMGIDEPKGCLEQLLLHGWLVQEGEQLLTSLADEEARTYLRNRLSPEERPAWYGTLARLSEQQRDYLTAAHDWCAGEHFQEAAELLSKHFQDIVEVGRLKELLSLCEKIAAAPLDRNAMARLYITMGRAALAVENVDTARRLLDSALSAPDHLLKAEACYYLGKTWEKVLLPQAQHYFDRGLQLLAKIADETLPPEVHIQVGTLQANLYIGKAWLYILHATDAARAEEVLQKAEAVISQVAQQQRSDLNLAVVNLHNALAGRYARQGDTAGELRHYHLAVITAREIGDKERLWRMLHNLAQAYIHARHDEAGLLFLVEAEQVAEAINSQEGIGKCLQTYGAYAFFQATAPKQTALAAQEQLHKAIACYTRAIEIFKQLGDDHWLAAAHADLTEAFVNFPDLPAARWHYLEAVARARRAGTEDVIIQLLNQLENDHPELTMKDLSERELFVLQVTKERGAITSGELTQLAKVSEATAERTLRKLKELNLLKSVGKGRSTKYVLPNSTL